MERSPWAREKRREMGRHPLTFLPGREIVDRGREHPQAIRWFALEDGTRTSYVLLPRTPADRSLLFAVAPALHVRLFCRLDTALGGVPLDVSLGEWAEEAGRLGTAPFEMTLNDVDLALLLDFAPPGTEVARVYDTLIAVLLGLLGPDSDEEPRCRPEAFGP